MKKDGESQGFEQARSADLLRPFSVYFSNPRSMAPRTAALLTCALLSPFRCGENPLIFPVGKTATSPWAQPSKPRSVFEGARGTKSAAAFWQMKADEVPMRHRVQQVLAQLHDNAELRARLLTQKPSLERTPRNTFSASAYSTGDTFGYVISSGSCSNSRTSFISLMGSSLR